MFCFLIFSLTIDPPLGAVPSEWPKYEKAIDKEKQTFTCFSGKKVIKLSKVNDGYPDCEDGSDEPGTSTFINGTFYCQNKGYLPQTIQKWSVSDGICDCCDGSDEMFNPHVKCPNTCASLESQRQQMYSKLNSIYTEGHNIYLKRVKMGQEKLSSAKKRKSELQSIIKKYEEDKRRVESTKALPAQTPVPISTPKPSESPAPEKISSPPVKKPSQSEMLDVKISALEEQITELRVREGEGYPGAAEELAKAKEELDNLLQQQAALAAEEQASGDGEKSESSDKDEDSDEGEIYAEKVTPEPIADNAIKDAPIEQPASEPVKEIEEPVWKTTIRAIWHYTFHVPDVRSSLEEGIRQKTLDDLDEKIRKARDDLRQQEKLADIDDKTDPAFIPIYGDSFKTPNGDYELKVMKDIDKSYTSHGHYRTTEGKIQRFKDGQHCWITQAGRKTDLELVCWNKDKFVSIIESDQCYHKAVFATPSACGDNEDISKFTVDQLQKIAEKVGEKL